MYRKRASGEGVRKFGAEGVRRVYLGGCSGGVVVVVEGSMFNNNIILKSENKYFKLIDLKDVIFVLFS